MKQGQDPQTLGCQLRHKTARDDLSLFSPVELARGGREEAVGVPAQCLLSSATSLLHLHSLLYLRHFLLHS